MACLLFGPAAAAADVQSEKTAICPSALVTRFVPLPIYSTLPNEGGTGGFMPVFLRICDANQRTESIIAPSVSWNDVIHLTGTLRWFHYPSDDQTLTFIASASTRINSNLLIQWRDLPRLPGAFTTEAELRWQRSAFYRFFCLGPTKTDHASNPLRGHAPPRHGCTPTSHWNAGAALFLGTDRVQDLGVPGLPL